MIAIISDIHGNFAALSAVLNSIGQMGIRRVVCLGDVAGYYTDVDLCCDALRQRDVMCLMGNHDWYLVSGEPCPRSGSANQCIEYQRQTVRSDTLQWLSSLKPQAQLDELNLVHAGWNDPLDEYLVPSDAYFARLQGDYFSSGHTHVQYCWRSTDNKLYCNPGSVGQPRDGDPRAAFATWDGLTFQLERVVYDWSITQRAMSAAGFSSHFYACLEKGTRIGGAIDAIPIER